MSFLLSKYVEDMSSGWKGSTMLTVSIPLTIIALITTTIRLTTTQNVQCQAHGRSMTWDDYLLAGAMVSHFLPLRGKHADGHLAKAPRFSLHGLSHRYNTAARLFR